MRLIFYCNLKYRLRKGCNFIRTEKTDRIHSETVFSVRFQFLKIVKQKKQKQYAFLCILNFIKINDINVVSYILFFLSMFTELVLNEHKIP